MSRTTKQILKDQQPVDMGVHKSSQKSTPRQPMPSDFPEVKEFEKRDELLEDGVKGRRRFTFEHTESFGLQMRFRAWQNTQEQLDTFLPKSKYLNGPGSDRDDQSSGRCSSSGMSHETS